MDFKLSDEQRDFVAAIRDFCEREAGTPEQREQLTKNHTELHNQGIYSKMAELGWLGLTIPEQYGGSGGTMLDACLFMEETSRGMAPIGGYATTLIVAGATKRFGTDDAEEGDPRRHRQGLGGGDRDDRARGRLGRRLAQHRGEALQRRLPDQWSEGLHLERPHLRPRPGRLPDHQGRVKHEGLSMIFVPRGADGMEVNPIDTMGGRETNTLYFSDCEVPEDALLGEIDQGWVQLMAGLNVERLILAATMLGIGQRAFDDALAYAKERKQFGRPIGSFQALQHRFADLATDLEAARLMTWWVAGLTDEDPDRMLPKEASMVKLFVTETAQRVALEGMQMMGGYGYSSEYDMERLVRATLVSTIYGGTSEIQRGIIAKTLGL